MASRDRNVRATIGVGLLAAGIAGAGIIWQVRQDYAGKPMFWLFVVLAVGGLAVLGSLLPLDRWIGDGVASSDALPPPIKRPTKEQVESLRVARAKQHRGGKLSRKERRLIEAMKPTKQGFLERLGHQLQLGTFYLDPIKYEGVKFEERWRNTAKPGMPKDELEALYDGMIVDTLAARDRASEWEKEVAQILRDEVGTHYKVLFESDAGLTPASAPDGLRDYVREMWQHHEMRLQRLHEIIAELSRQWLS